MSKQLQASRATVQKYISIKPEILSMAENLQDKLYINFSSLISRLILESHSKVFGTTEIKKFEAAEKAITDIDPLA